MPMKLYLDKQERDTGLIVECAQLTKSFCLYAVEGSLSVMTFQWYFMIAKRCRVFIISLTGAPL